MITSESLMHLLELAKFNLRCIYNDGTSHCCYFGH
jgi:hypothetical protein